MKLAIFSDTHTYHRQVQLPMADVLVCCGDITGAGEMKTIVDFVPWMAEQPHPHKIFVPGNHDYCFDITSTKYVPGLYQLFEEHGIAFCIDRRVEIEGVVFYGTPWVPNLPGWAFHDRGRDRHSHMPTDVQVLVSHGPPWGFLDQNSIHIGCKHLLSAIRRLPRLRVHAFGHIHEGHGHIADRADKLQFVNACICTREYKPTNKPWLVEFEP